MIGHHLDGEVVAFIYGSVISNDPLKYHFDKRNITAWLTREEAQMMATCDMGQKWQDLAKGRTIVTIKNGKVFTHTGKEVEL